MAMARPRLRLWAPHGGSCGAAHAVAAFPWAALWLALAASRAMAAEDTTRLWTVGCSKDCNGVNMCAQACSGEQVQKAQCPAQADCLAQSSLSCQGGQQACQFSDWADWQQDPSNCTGLCTRRRNITAPNRCGGAPCQGPLEDTKVCNSTCNPVQDCVLSNWTSWSHCGVPVLNQRQRSRYVKVMPVGAGQDCEGGLNETEACDTALKGSDCHLSEWMDWGPCSSDCGGGGQRTRHRIIVQKASYGGKGCDAAVEDTASCPSSNNASCAAKTDCSVSPWSEWSPCLSSRKTRKRVVSTPSKNGGKACSETLDEAAPCANASSTSSAPAPSSQVTDCSLSDWTAWQLCDKSCDGGQTYRTREVKSSAANGGRACNDTLAETMECNNHLCESDSANHGCSASSWNDWSSCSSSCGPGSRTRSRHIVAEAHSGGRPCNMPLETIAACDDSHPDCQAKDCQVGDWSSWSACSATCGGGQQGRQRDVTQNATAGGKPCVVEDLAEAQNCSTQACPVQCQDGRWEDWGSWSSCTKDCRGGYMYRSRNVAQTASSCGRPASGNSLEVMDCNANVECKKGDVDCALSQWAEWGSCSASCLGLRMRNRTVATHGQGHGAYCGTASLGEPLSQVESCGSPPESCGISAAVDCVVGVWGEWSACDRSCEGGQQIRSRQVTTPASGHGNPCQGSLRETQPCNDGVNCTTKVDCQLGNWGDWGACTQCSGQRTRQRSVVSPASHGGNECNSSALTEAGQCRKTCGAPSPFYCVWTDWSAYGACSVTCGNGTQKRTRPLGSVDSAPITGFASLANKPEECTGAEVEYSKCSTDACATECHPRDCSLGDWGEWSQPTCNGLCERTRPVMVVPNECGKPCEGSLAATKACTNVPENCTQAPHDCKFGDWGTWSSCSSPMSQKYRQRTIQVLPDLEGKACQGSTNDTEQCSVDTSPTSKVDCKLSDWGNWDTCDRTCGEGQRGRSRTVASEASGGGAGCTGALQEKSACPNQPNCASGGEDCQFGDWSVWTGCNESKDTQAFRERHVLKQATGQGAPCKGDTKETTACPHVASTDCAFNAWSDWKPCSSTCEGGQTNRSRTIKDYSKAGGHACAGDMIVVKPCNDKVPCQAPTDCQMSEWSQWSACSPTCGQGYKVRSRNVVAGPTDGKQPCPSNITEVTGCNQGKCPDTVDCVWEDWADWAPCVKANGTCGIGYKKRARGIKTLPSKGGTQCPPRIKEEYVAQAGCQGQQECCIDGDWGDWGDWTACNVQCGGGTRHRQRALAQEATWCGKPAKGSPREYQGCGDTACGDKDCQLGTWGDWSPKDACPGPCSQGHQERQRAVTQNSTGSGRPCSGTLLEWKMCPYDNSSCTKYTGVPADCVLSDWGDWSECSTTCGLGSRTHMREVKAQPRYGGKPCPSASLQEFDDCGMDVPCTAGSRVDCVWTTWTAWSHCSDGQQNATRGHKMPPRNGGLPCIGPVVKVKPCGSYCYNESYQCLWGDWEQWGPCSATCGSGGMRTRQRSLQVSDEPVDAKPQAVYDVQHLPEAQARSDTPSGGVTEVLPQGSTRTALIIIAVACVGLVGLVAAARGLGWFGGTGDRTDRSGSRTRSFFWPRPPAEAGRGDGGGIAESINSYASLESHEPEE